MTFNKTPPPFKTSPLVDDELDDEEAIKVTEKKLENDIVDETLDIDEIVNIKESRNHPLENVIGNLTKEPLGHKPKTKELVPQPRNTTIIGTNWVFRNKLDENGIISRNKAKLVAQGYNQQKGIDYDETFALVARLESIRILLAYACALDFKLFQMDVKSAFVNDFINEEVYVAQPMGFIDFEKPDHVYKLKKALYGLKQAPKAWSLDELELGAPSKGPYQTILPSPDDIILYVREDREWGNWDHVPACLLYMLYCVANSERFNLAYFMAKRMGWVTKQARLILPYGKLLTRLFDFIVFENPKLQNESYVLYDRVMNPLATQLERKVQRNRGTRRGRPSTSSPVFDQPSSSHLNNDDNDGNDEGTSCASTPSPICYVNSLTNQVPQVFQNTPNIEPHLEPFYTHQTEIINRQVQLRDEQRGGVRSIEKSLRRLWRNMKK
uniref:Retrovirus-related Pol polyprotein from transposon TNT 1-94 n=1 Tax=Tanacetum cinerariifolium TaxID=118510 RepID=A0A699HL18_TANCI|nr:retrovirus-related Pol polyprotein from transposon TNT 1-94 [Tanacetum cinerariifolium]